MNVELSSTFTENNIPICFSVDNNYAKYFSVALQSIVENSSNENNYDMIVLAENISEKNQSLLLEQVNNRSNFNLRFVNILNYTKNLPKDIFYTCAWYEKSTYYRFFIQDILKAFDKVLYLDSDIVVLDDVAKLYNIELEDNIAGVAKDIEMARYLNTSMKNRILAYHKKFGINDSSKYFQAGVMLFNLRLMREQNIGQKLFEKLAEVKTPQCVDQDILNMVCFDKLKYFDTAWNIEWILLARNHDLAKELPQNIYAEFQESLKEPKIIHYCDSIKPWNEKDLPLANYFWQYAIKTPFYNAILIGEKKTNKNNFLTTLKYIHFTLLSLATKGKAQRKYRDKRNNLKSQLRNVKGFSKIE